MTSNTDYREELLIISGEFEELIENRNLKNGLIVTRPFGLLGARLSWKDENGLSKNILSEIVPEEDHISFEGNSWKDEKREGSVYRRWTHISDIPSITLGEEELEMDIKNTIVETYEELSTISSELDLGEPQKLELSPDEVSSIEVD
ncbi:hypothetical protein SAMN04487948_10916 [Halogranum amylolyticum]|uniref:Uncharacterized protein n=1 Tax=Halogranum amylolyticum TaxID=660520 RepID=A0A1H8TZ88_9EURY|nr:hypothetical protein [Halogranum amylolyticum]SEO96231.1 hypothetical protein SAMN04487948_10916 [Halogranum amylolyticum]